MDKSPRQSDGKKSCDSRLHNVSMETSIIIKSAVMSKKKANSIGSYEQCLFQLHANGLLLCYEWPTNKEKIKKDEIMITASSHIEKRWGGNRRESKFIISSHGKEWYLWCNYSAQHGKDQAMEWCDVVNEIIEQPSYQRMDSITNVEIFEPDIVRMTARIDNLEDTVNETYATDDSSDTTSSEL